MKTRLPLAFVALIVVTPAMAASLTDDEAMATPCRTYLASKGTAIYGALQDAIVTRLSGSPAAARFGSACNMADYVEAECKVHRGDDVRGALDRLERAGAVGRLPTIRMCGA